MGSLLGGGGSDATSSGEGESRFGGDTRYLVTEEPDGTLILTPAVVMTTHEAALLRNPELVAEIRANKADPSRLVQSKARRPRKPSA